MENQIISVLLELKDGFSDLKKDLLSIKEDLSIVKENQKKLEMRQIKLQERQEKHEMPQKKLEKRQEKLEKHQSNLEYNQEIIKTDLQELKYEIVADIEGKQGTSNIKMRTDIVKITEDISVIKHEIYNIDKIVVKNTTEIINIQKQLNISI